MPKTLGGRRWTADFFVKRQVCYKVEDYQVLGVSMCQKTSRSQCFDCIGHPDILDEVIPFSKDERITTTIECLVWIQNDVGKDTQYQY